MLLAAEHRERFKPLVTRETCASVFGIPRETAEPYFTVSFVCFPWKIGKGVLFVLMHKSLET